ncbi:MAG: hypothetical protein ABIK15_04045 [Pseudomonadota bacterium]
MERREDCRVKVSSNSFVINPYSKKKIGQIADISRGGLSFYYINPASIPSNFSMELGIWFQEQDLFLPDIVADTVSDIEVEYGNPFQQIPLRRRGVRFRNLSYNRNEQLYSAYGAFLTNKKYEPEKAHFHCHPL